MHETFENFPKGGRPKIAFENLLTALSPDRVVAGEKYIDLRSKLRKFFALKYCRESDLDELVDETLDRVTAKLGAGEVIENVKAYTGGVARNVLHEYWRRPSPDPLPDPPAPSPEPSEETEARLACLEKCLATFSPEDREMIRGYYDAEEGEKNKNHRKDLADRLGKSSGALKVSANRLRERLRRCITACLGGADV